MFEKEFKGRESELVTFKLRLEDVRRFAEAAGVPFEGQVPLTYMGTLLQGTIPGFELTTPGIIHGEQKITYHQPLKVGDSLTYKRRIQDIYERKGKRGKMTIVVCETLGYNLAGECLFTSSSTLIIPQRGENNEESDRI